MINKLLDNCLLSEYATSVDEVVEDNSLFWHAFKDTIFFMEGGGMQADLGVIAGHPVIEMKIENGKQWHLLDTKLEGNVMMSINLHERFRKCQVHTTQHLISALLGNIYNVKTLSHHVGDDENDIEFDFENFTDKMASELQVLCNGLIRDDVTVEIQYPTRVEALKHAPREKLEHSDLRVVKIGTLDYNLCGCMHVPSLRYIQMVHILGYEKTTKGYKVKYICGDQLLDCVARRYHVLDEASHSLSLSHLYINTGINKLLNEQKALTRDVIVWKQKYFEELAKSLCVEGEDLIVKSFDDIDVKSVAQLAQFLSTNYNKKVVLHAHLFDKSRIVIAAPKDSGVDCQKVFNDIASQFQLKGGGNAQLAQGGGMTSVALDEYINSLRVL